MRKTLSKIGFVMFAGGMLAGLLAFAYVAFVFVTEVIPFFWQRGDYMPVVFAAILGLIIGGAFLGSLAKDKETT